MPSPKCPSKMIQSHKNSNICYLFVSNPATFDEAEKFCHQNNGHLTPVFDSSANHFISYNADDAFKNLKSFWIGGKTIAVNEATIWAWTWQNSLVLFSEWDNGQPNKSGCMSSTTERALWKSEDCNQTKPFVCQISAFIDVCDPEWSYFKPSNPSPYPEGMCYRYLVQPGIAYMEAQNYCQGQGGNLVSIHTEDENNFVSELVAYGAADNWPELGVFIGLHYVDSQWKWFDGTEVNFINWGPDRPHFITHLVVANLYPRQTKDDQNWAHRWDNGFLNLNRFVCKKKPNFVYVPENLL